MKLINYILSTVVLLNLAMPITMSCNMETCKIEIKKNCCKTKSTEKRSCCCSKFECKVDKKTVDQVLLDPVQQHLFDADYSTSFVEFFLPIQYEVRIFLSEYFQRSNPPNFNNTPLLT